MTIRNTNISRPPKTENVDLNVWMQEVKFRFENYVQVLEAPVSKSGIIGNWVHGKHPTKNLTAANSAYFGFIVPASLAEFKEVAIRIIPTGTGTINYTVNLSYGGVGEDENTNARTTAVVGASVTDDQLTELDITTLFTSLSPGVDQPDPNDSVGVELVLDAVGGGTTDIEVMSVYIKYI